MRSIPRMMVILTFGLMAIMSKAFALTVLKQDEAKNYLGDVKAHILAGSYTYDILSRNHRDSMHGRFSDGVLFNPTGGKNLFLRRKDGDYKMVINSPDGREKDPVNEDNWRQRINNVLSDDNTFPTIFLDDAKKELVLVFVGRGTQVTGQMNDKGLLEISISVEGARDRSMNSKRMY